MDAGFADRLAALVEERRSQLVLGLDPDPAALWPAAPGEPGGARPPAAREAAGGKAVSKSYLLGISSDGGKTWKFADGAGLDKKESRDKTLPKLPAELQLPMIEPPAITKDN